jgi:flagellar assembly protein FliH
MQPMANANGFLFRHDFRRPAAADAKHQAALAEAEARGRAAGVAAGLAQAQRATETRIAEALEGLGARATRLLDEAEARQAALEEEALGFALSFARKLAGEALRVHPTGPIAQAARAAFQHLRAVPHLVVRVNDGLVSEVDALVGRLAREHGFEGRLIVMGEPEIAPGDVRLEWADGGVLRERCRTEAAVAGLAEPRPTASNDV